MLPLNVSLVALFAHRVADEPATEEPLAPRPRPDKARSPEVRFLIHDASQCQRDGDLVGAALRVDVLVTLCPRSPVFGEWLTNLRRRIDLEHERDRAKREEGYQTVILSRETVARIVEHAEGRESGVACSLAPLDLELRGRSSISIDADGLANSLFLVRRERS